ncbi:MAG: nucleoside deaminase [Deltaproteobacteria bacterium]|nr:MAG: nucleoside deaminase [Deltaproteobacteria bacterium]
MGIALEQARAAGAAGDVPVGAAIAIDGQLVATGRNRRQATGDPTAHAEIEALRAAARRVGNWRVEGTLYVTQEPCPMCAGALVNARVRRLVYGCDNPKAGAVRTLYAIPTDGRLNHRVEVVGGVRAGECGALLTAFFEALRARKAAARTAGGEAVPPGRHDETDTER